MSTIALRNVCQGLVNDCKIKTGEAVASKAIVKMIIVLTEENERMAKELQRLIPLEHQFESLLKLLKLKESTDKEISDFVNC